MEPYQIHFREFFKGGLVYNAVLRVRSHDITLEPCGSDCFYRFHKKSVVLFSVNSGTGDFMAFKVEEP